MTDQKPRIVFMGTPEFAVSSLQACMDIGEVVLAVTQPDKPVGRSGRLEPPPVKVLALSHGIPVVQPAKVKGSDLHETVTALSADVAVVAAYGKILPQMLLDAPRFGCVNVHASLLPRYRGAAPIQWAIANGETKAGVSLMKMEAGLDTGPFFAQAALPMAPDETGTSLTQKLSLLGADMLREHLLAYLNGERPLTAQDEREATWAPIIQKRDGAIDFTLPASLIEARLRAFTPWPGAFTELFGKLFKIHAARAVDGSGAPGVVLSAGKDGIAVGTGEGILVCTEIQLEGSRRMTAADFLKGRAVAPGTRLGRQE